MAELTQETVRLLDRLFNLKGEENVIIKGIEERIRETKGLIDDEEQARLQNDVARVDCEGRLEVFNTQRQIFENAFVGIDNDTFSALRDIGVNAEIGTMLETIAKEAPAFCEGLEKQIDDYKKAIEENKNRKDALSSELEELESSKEQSIEDREKLISLLEQSLSDSDMERESLSASYVKKILTLFGLFDDAEINSLAKLIIFPDDGLYDYSDSYEERLRNGLVKLSDDALEEEPELTGEIEEPSSVLAGDGEVPFVPSEDVPEEVPVDETVGMEPAGADEDLEKDKKNDGLAADDVYGKKSAEVGEGFQDIVPVPPVPGLDGRTTLLDLSSLNAQLEAAETFVNNEDRRASQQDVDRDEVITLNSDNDEDAPKFGDLGTPSVDENPELDEVSEDEKSPLDLIKEHLESIGLNMDRFAEFNPTLSEEDILKLFEGISQKTIEENYELLRSIDASSEAIFTCVALEGGLHLYLTDLDLNKKITALRAKGLSDRVTKELIEAPAGALRLSFATLEEKMEAIESSVGKIDSENIKLIETDIVLYNRNCRELASFGLELDEQELRNNKGILMSTTNIPADLDVLKNYLISLVRKNGKYALAPFWKTQYELLTDIDDLIEADLDGLFEGTPEVLGQNISEVIRRVQYCKEKNIPVYDEEGNFYDYIVDYTKFEEKFGKVNFAALEDRTSVNESLPYVIGNEGYVEILTNILRDYYASDENLALVDCDADVQSIFENMKSKLSESFNLEASGKYTYRIEDVSISKNKFERHLIVLLNALAGSGQLEEVETTVAREILLTALLYNLRQDYETLKKVVDSGLSFKVNVKTLGGSK